MNRLVRPLAFTSALASLAIAALAFQPETKPAPKDGEKPKDSQPARPEGAPKGGQPGGPDGRPPRGPGGPGGREGAGAEAGMKMMNRALKMLKGQISDASKKDENLRLINDMQRGCVTAKGGAGSPELFKKAKDDAEKAKWQKEYRSSLIMVLRKLIDAEQAVIDGKNADADKLLTEIAAKRDEMHKLMGIDED